MRRTIDDRERKELRSSIARGRIPLSSKSPNLDLNELRSRDRILDVFGVSAILPTTVAPEPRPEALHQIELSGLPTAGLRSKSWDEFSGPSAPKLDFVFTVCDNAAKEQCPYWPGQPMTAHWGVSDPAAVVGTPEGIARAFNDVFTVLERRIELFLSLPLATLEEMTAKRKIDQIGRS